MCRVAFLLFFFFKQKTAYEVRISDWSSDVCSTDLKNLQLGPDAFADMVEKAKAKGLTPMALGVGDRPYPGAHLTHEALLKKLGTADYDALLKGKLPWSDPRVVETLTWIRSLTDAGLLPNTFATLKLAEAHIYFHTNPGALTFLNGSWYTSRAFNPT